MIKFSRFTRPVLSISLVSVLTLALTGCGFMLRDPAPTPYQPYINTTWHSIPDGDGNILGGYSDEHIKGTRYSVTFKGNGATSRSIVTKYAHRRARELCKEKGYRDYKIMRHGEVDDVEYVPHAGVKYPIVTLNFHCVK